MKRRVYQDELDVHFVTFSCYKRRKLLSPDRAKRIVISLLAARLGRYEGICLGFVVMPDHVHAMVWFDTARRLSPLMNHWKDETSRQIKLLFRRNHPAYWEKIDSDDPVWQARYYSFNVQSEAKIREKLDYMHLNPVRAGHVEHAVDWPWSSARWYLLGKSVGVPVGIPAGIGL